MSVFGDVGSMGGVWAASVVRTWRRRWCALSPAARITTALLAAMIAAGVVLRLWDVGFPPRFTFDEQHFVPNARSYLLGQTDDNDHPPLGKLLIAAGLLLFGDNPTGWRAASLIFGLQTLVVAGAVARALFADRRAGWYAAAFLAADGFFLAYSRTALLDGGLTCLVLWSFLAALTARTWRGVLACAILVGLAASVKWSGGMVFVPAAVTIVMQGRVSRWSVLLFVVAPIVHLLLWLATFPLCGRPVDPHALLILVRDLLHHHVELGRAHNPLASPWYSWPVLYHPIVVKLADHGTRRRYASSLGHPLLFFSSTIAVFTLLLAGLVAALSIRVRQRLPPVTRAAGLLTVGWLAMLAPWMVGRGSYTFMYHYLPSYGFALILVSGIAAHLERRRPTELSVYVGLVLLIGIFFAPVWAEFSLADVVANRRLMFTAWQP